MSIHSILTQLFLGGLLVVGSMSYAQVDTPGESQDTLPRPRPVSGPGELKPSVGVLGGFTAPDSNDYRSSIEYGIEAAFQPYFPFTVGLELSQADYDGDGDLPDIERTKVLVKGAYNMGGTVPVIRHSYVGFGLGPLIDRGDANVTYFGFMPNFGFDIPVAQQQDQNLTVGANARYLISSAEANPDALSLNGVVKYWF